MQISGGTSFLLTQMPLITESLGILIMMHRALPKIILCYQIFVLIYMFAFSFFLFFEQNWDFKLPKHSYC